MHAAAYFVKYFFKNKVLALYVYFVKKIDSTATKRLMEMETFLKFSCWWILCSKNIFTMLPLLSVIVGQWIYCNTSWNDNNRVGWNWWAFKNVEDKKDNKKGNKIPKEVRNLLRKKTKLSKSILKSNSGEKTVKMMKSLEEIENSLENSYKAMKLEKEKEALGKIKRNPKYFFS